MEEKQLTVGELRKALEGVPDDLKVELWSDSGVDQCDFDDCIVVVEEAWRHQYKLSEGKTFDDGSTGKDYFVIYANYRDK